LELIRKDDVLDAIDDDDNIEWPRNPYEGDALDDIRETPEELLAMIIIKGSPCMMLQSELRKLCMEFIDVFATKVRREPAMVDPMEIKVDESRWRLPCNTAPPRRHSVEKKREIRKQVDALEKLGVIRESSPSCTETGRFLAIHSRLREIEFCNGEPRRLAYPQYSADSE